MMKGGGGGWVRVGRLGEGMGMGGCRVYGRWTGWCRERWGLFGWPLMALQ